MRSRNGFGSSGNGSSLVGALFEYAAKKAINEAISSKQSKDTNIVFRIRTKYCKGLKCQKCALICPENVITFKMGKIGINDIKNCRFCGLCESVCPRGCITVKKKL